MRVVKILFLLLLACLPSWAAPSPIDLVEWLFERPLNCVEIQLLSQQQGSENWTQIAATLDHPSDTQRASLLQRFKSDNQPFATTACKLDAIAHREMAPGLQFQSSVAFAEWLLFGMAVVDREDTTQVLPGPHFRDAVQATLVGQWPKLSPHYREVLVGFPGYWANMRKAWPSMSFENKNVTAIAWQNNLADVVQRDDVIRLASASLQDLQDTVRSHPTPQQLEIACQRLEFSARRLRRPDVQDPQLADQLSQFSAQVRQQEAGQLESAALMQKLDIPKVWYSPIWTDDLDFPGYWNDGPWGWGWGWGNGYPYLW